MASSSSSELEEAIASCQDGHARAARGSTSITKNVRATARSIQCFNIEPLIPTFASGFQKPKDIRADLGRIVAPVAVHFPGHPGQRVAVFGGPVPHGIVGVAELCVRSPMCGCRSHSRR